MSDAEFASDDPPKRSVADGAINIKDRRWKKMDGKMATRRFHTSVGAVADVSL